MKTSTRDNLAQRVVTWTTRTDTIAQRMIQHIPPAQDSEGTGRGCKVI